MNKHADGTARTTYVTERQFFAAMVLGSSVGPRSVGVDTKLSSLPC